MNRKDFIKKFAFGGSILLTAPVILSSCSDDDEDLTPNDENNDSGSLLTIDLSDIKYADLNTVGGSVYEGNIIIFRTGDSTYLALSKICTHQGCTVAYSHASGNILCPCHASQFTTSGSVINGPAPSSLKAYNVEKNGNELTIS